MNQKITTGDILVSKLERHIGQQATTIALQQIEIERLRGELNGSELEQQPTERKESSTKPNSN